MTREGDIFLNKEPIALQEISQRVQAGLAKDPELLAVINADDHAIHGAVVEVMDKVRLAASRVWLLPSNRSGGVRRECWSYRNAVYLYCAPPAGTHRALNGQWLSLASGATAQLDPCGNARRAASTRRVRTGPSLSRSPCLRTLSSSQSLCLPPLSRSPSL